MAGLEKQGSTRIDTRALRCFVWVADVGSISRAADELAIVQSALSRKIQALEQEVGAPLFVRLSRGVQLTPAGRRFLQHARRILREFDAALVELRDAPSAPEGTVTLGLSPTLAPIVAPGFVEIVQQQFPGIALKVVEGFTPALLDLLASGRIDIAVLTNPPRSSVWRQRPALAEEVGVLTAPGARGIRPYFTADELCREPLLITSGFRTVVDDQLRRLGLRLQPAMEIDSVEAIRRIVLAGKAATLMPASTFQDDVRAGRLEAFHIADVKLHRLLVVCSPLDARSTPAIEQAAEALALQFGALVDEGRFALLAAPAVAPARTRRKRPAPGDER